ncbi:Rhodanese-like domain [Sesbania bispinosa]|nr:Rhodanese-like domain [Sesbania bispinosa]
MKAMIATSFDFSAVCFHSCSPNPRQSRRWSSYSFLKSPNSHNGRRSVTVQPNSPNFRMETALKGNLETIGVPTSVPVRVAHELLLAGHKYLDVRTPEEFNAGHAPGAINIPYMFRVGSGMTKNSNFVKEGCQLGKRSMMAASDLLAAVSVSFSRP